MSDSEVLGYPSHILFDLARNDHAMYEVRVLAAGELLARGDARANHIEVAPFAEIAKKRLDAAMTDVSAAADHVPTSPEPEEESGEMYGWSKKQVGKPKSSPLIGQTGVTTKTLLQDEVILVPEFKSRKKLDEKDNDILPQNDLGGEA